MVQAVPADKIDDQKHQERATDHYRDGYLQAKLKIAGIRDFPYQLRTQSAQELRDEHVDADGRGVRALRSQIAQDRGDGAVIPGHKETADEEGGKEDPFFV